MSRRLKALWLILLLGVLAAGVYLAVHGRYALRTATASVSQSLCGAAFVSRIDTARVFADEQRPLMPQIAWALHYDIDRARREVRTTAFGLFDSRAAYRNGLGCVLLHGDDALPEPEGLSHPAANSGVRPAVGAHPGAIALDLDRTPPKASRPGARLQQQDHTPAASGGESNPKRLKAASTGESAAIVAPVDPALRKALDDAFAEPDPAHPRHTLAVVVMHDGKVIAERYAPGIGPDTPLHVHSISKSVTNALIGILVRQGKLQRQQPAPVPAWQGAQDPRRAVTIDQLLRMDSGLPFDETGEVLSLSNRMWLLERDSAAFAEQIPLAHPPGTRWGYSNLGYQLLSRMVRDAAGGRCVAAQRFIRRELFAPAGMRSAVVNCDSAGTPLGSSHVYASARDVARFGQLYLDDGVAHGQRVLPAGWARYSASQTLDTGYGAGFWTNLVNQGSVPVWDAPWGMPQLPRDMFYARGYLGQYAIIIPSQRLVVARLGFTQVDARAGIADATAAIIAALHAQAGNIPAR